MKTIRVTKDASGFTIICAPEHKTFTISHIATTYATKNGIELKAIKIKRS